MPGDDRCFVVVGRAHREGAIDVFDSFLSTAAQPTESVPDGAFSLAFVDAKGSVLDESAFPVAFDTPHIPFPLPTAGFSVARPLPAGTAAAQLRFEGRVLSGVERPSQAPVIGSVRTRRSESGDLEIEWDMESPDGGTGRLTAALALSYDGAEPWLPVAGGLREPRFTLAVDGLGAADAAVVKVSISDGFEMADAVSEPFVLAGAPPVPVILAPADGARLVAKEPELLRGAALGPREGLLPDGALEWRLRTEGETVVLGTGADLEVRLAEGDHVIELAATDAAGQQAAIERHVTARRRMIGAQALRVAHVSATDAVALFSPAGSVSAVDRVEGFVMAGLEGLGRLQSRTWSAEPDAPAAGCTAYLYRVVLTDLAGDPATGGVVDVRLAFGEIEPVEFGAGGVTDAFVLTEGALGSVMPSGVELDDGVLVLTFDPPVRAGAKPGAGEDSLFAGVASRSGPRPAEATVIDLFGGEHPVGVQAPL